MKVHGPTIEGSTFAGEGFPVLTHTATMRYVVEGVKGDWRTRWQQAENAPGIPAYREFFPGLEDEFVFVVRKRPRPLDSETFEVLVAYERPQTQAEEFPEDEEGEPRPEDARLTTSGATIEVETNKDKDGNLISVSYTPAAATAIAASLGAVAAPTVQTALVRVRKRVVRMVFSRTERKQPTRLIEDFSNTFNSDQVGRYAPGELFLENIDSTSTDGQKTFSVDYNIIYQKGGGYDPSVYFVDPRTGRPPADLVEGVGIKTIPSYDAQPFAELRLPWPKD